MRYYNTLLILCIYYFQIIDLTPLCPLTVRTLSFLLRNCLDWDGKLCTTPGNNETKNEASQRIQTELQLMLPCYMGDLDIYVWICVQELYPRWASELNFTLFVLVTDGQIEWWQWCIRKRTTRTKLKKYSDITYEEVILYSRCLFKIFHYSTRKLETAVMHTDDTLGELG